MDILYQPPIMGEKQYYLNFASGYFQPHWHSEIELHYCIAGSYDIVIENIRYKVSQNEAVFISSADEHEFCGLTPDLKVMVVEIGYNLLGSDFIEIAFRRFEEPIIRFGDISADTEGKYPVYMRIRELFISLLRESGNKDYYSGWLIKAYLYELSSLIARNIPAERNSPGTRMKKLEKIMKVQPVIDYISRSYNRDITIKDAAAILNYESKSFCRIFKSATGMTFHSYLNSYRINNSRVLLESGNCTVKEAGALCGISCQKSFCRLFRQYVKMTPTEYKAIYNKKAPRKL